MFLSYRFVKFLIVVLTIVSAQEIVWAQDIPPKVEKGEPPKLQLDTSKKNPETTKKKEAKPAPIPTNQKSGPQHDIDRALVVREEPIVRFPTLEALEDLRPGANPLDKKPRQSKPKFASNEQAFRTDRFHWKPAVRESLLFLGIQHGLRMTQQKTRNELGGKFFRDWGRSARNLRGWSDGDSHFTNYVAHPMQGAITGRIFINNSEKSRRQIFGKSKEYWRSRLTAFAWSSVWSTQFELGVLGETSIGNVGVHNNYGPSRMSWKDLVITPTAGTGVVIGEDIIEKYVLRGWLEKRSSRTRIKIFRTFFTPFQSFSNVLRGKKPWHRDNRNRRKPR